MQEPGDPSWPVEAFQTHVKNFLVPDMIQTFPGGTAEPLGGAGGQTLGNQESSSDTALSNSYSANMDTPCSDASATQGGKHSQADTSGDEAEPMRVVDCSSTAPQNSWNIQSPVLPSPMATIPQSFGSMFLPQQTGGGAILVPNMITCGDVQASPMESNASSMTHQPLPTPACGVPPESLQRAPELPAAMVECSYPFNQTTGNFPSVAEDTLCPTRFSGTAEQTLAEEEDGPGSCVYVWSTASRASNEENGDGSSEAAGILLSQPSKFSSCLRILSVACGQSLAAFIAADRKLYCWDWDLSSGDLHASSPQLVEGAGIDKMVIKQVSCGASHLACVTDSGRVFTYGSNESGQRGMAPENPKSSRLADEVFFSSQAKQVSCGPRYTLVVLDDGRVYGMGDGSHGVLGDVANKIVRVPTKINFQDRRVSFVAAGMSHALAITDLGSTYAWGRNDCGQLGLGHTDDRCTPQVVCELSGHKTVMVAAHTASVALTKERKLYAWGTNSLLSPALIFSQAFQDVDVGDALFCLADDGGEQSLLVTPMCQLRSGSATSGCMRLSLSGVTQLSAAPGVLVAVGPQSDEQEAHDPGQATESSDCSAWQATPEETQDGGSEAFLSATARTLQTHAGMPLKSALRRYSEGCLTSASRSSSVGSDRSRKRVTFAETVTMVCVESRPNVQVPDDATSCSVEESRSAPSVPNPVKKREGPTGAVRQDQCSKKTDARRPRARSASPGGRPRAKGSSMCSALPSRQQVQPCLRAAGNASTAITSGSTAGSSGRTPTGEQVPPGVDSKGAKMSRKSAQATVASQVGMQNAGAERRGTTDAPRISSKNPARRPPEDSPDPFHAEIVKEEKKAGDGDSCSKETTVPATKSKDQSGSGETSRTEKSVSMATDDELAGATTAEVAVGPSGGSTPEFGFINNVYCGGSPSSSNTPLPVQGAFCSQELMPGSLGMGVIGHSACDVSGHFTPEEFNKLVGGSSMCAALTHDNASALAHGLERNPQALLASPNDLAVAVGQVAPLSQAPAQQQKDFLPLLRDGLEAPTYPQPHRVGQGVVAGTGGSAPFGVPLQERGSEQTSLGSLSQAAPLAAVGQQLQVYPAAPGDRSDPMAAPQGPVGPLPSSVAMMQRLAGPTVGWGPSQAAPFPANQNCFGSAGMLLRQPPQNFFGNSELSRFYDVSDIVKKQKEFREIRSVLCAAQEDIVEVEKEKEELRRELRETKSALKEALGKLEESKESNGTMERMVAAQKKRIQTLQEELDEEAQQSHKDLTQVLQKLSFAEQERAKLAHSLATAQEALQTFQKNKSSQERLEREASALRQQLKSQKSEQAHQLRQAEEAIGEWRDAHAKLQEALVETEEHRKSEVNERQAEVDHLKKQVRQLEEELQQVKDQVDMTSQSTIEAERQRRVAAEERVDELEAALNELAADFAASKRASTRQKRDLDSMTEEKQRALQEIEELREELQKARDEIGQGEIFASNLQSEIHELRTTVAGAESTKNQQRELTENLEQKLAEVTGELSCCKEELSKKEEELQKYEKLAEKSAHPAPTQACSECKNLTAELLRSAEQRDTMNSQIEALQSDLTAHQNAARDQQVLIHELQMELGVYKQRQAAELKVVTEQKNYLEKKVHDLKEAKEESDEKLFSLQEKLTSLRKEEEEHRIRERLVTAQVDQLFQVLRHHVDLKVSASEDALTDSSGSDGSSEHAVLAESKAISVWSFEAVHAICEKWNIALLVDTELHKLRDRLFDLTRKENELKHQLVEAADHQQTALQARQKLEELEEKLRRTQMDAERNEKMMQEAQQAGSWSTTRFLEQQKYFEMELGITKRQLTECRSEVHQLRTRNSALLLDLTKQEERIASLIKQNERLAARQARHQSTDRSAATSTTSASSLDASPADPAFPFEGIYEDISPRKHEFASPRRESKSRTMRVDMLAA
ncbi:regulator of chromosome condensation (RCC1) repeat-containing protein [Toxoplasma gondii CAST]|uniref:Regulator of chromosome condensation (RCC1) repeat-containing protein n=1 Tax=Toxoplasma gondii CAST TaxID=943122 RepID=A0A3R7YTL7_TOXGO|nr:regulator of chromosome condensation (RCC1) repeat-containing protein [Toxoplasma gondii CAST]